MIQTSSQAQRTYAAFLRGINVGGHHEVPMADLKTALAKLGFSHIKTLLNSGNVVFKTRVKELKVLEEEVSTHLEKTFGFPIPVLIREMEDIHKLVTRNPFKDIEVHKDIRLYITFMRATPKEGLEMPWISPDGYYRILAVEDKIVMSVLDVSQSKTTDAMKILEKNYTRDITTRNWNTLVKIASLAE